MGKCRKLYIEILKWILKFYALNVICYNMKIWYEVWPRSIETEFMSQVKLFCYVEHVLTYSCMSGHVYNSFHCFGYLCSVFKMWAFCHMLIYWHLRVQNSTYALNMEHNWKDGNWNISVDAKGIWRCSIESSTNFCVVTLF
jgi:hypothetical protein